MRPAVGAQPAGIHQRLGVPAIRLHPPAARGVHRREVGIRHDHLVPQLLEAAGDPFALGRGLDQDAGPRALAQRLSEPVVSCHDAPLDDLAVIAEPTDLTFILVDVDANVLHGWPPSSCGSDRVEHGVDPATGTTSGWGSAASSHLSSPVHRRNVLRLKLAKAWGFSLVVRRGQEGTEEDSEGATKGRPSGPSAVFVVGGGGSLRGDARPCLAGRHSAVAQPSRAGRPSHETSTNPGTPARLTGGAARVV